MFTIARTFFENSLNLPFFQKRTVIPKKESSANYSETDDIMIFIFHVIASDGTNKVIIELLCHTTDGLVQSIRYEQDTCSSSLSTLSNEIFADGKKAKADRIAYWKRITGQLPQKRVFATVDKRRGSTHSVDVMSFNRNRLAAFMRSFIDLIDIDQNSGKPELSILGMHQVNRFLRAHL